MRTPRRRAPKVRIALLAALVMGLPSGAHAGPVVTTDGFVADGPVTAAVPDAAGTTYVGGAFRMLGPRTGSLLGLTASDDQPAAGFPDANGPVLAIADDGSGGWFIGGGFTAVGGLPRGGLAHVRADGSVDPTWSPVADLPVFALARSGTSLFVGGSFTSIGSGSGGRLAKLSTTGSGLPVPGFAAGLDDGSDQVRVVKVQGGSVYVGGIFASAGGAPRTNLARLSATTGAADAWDPAPNAQVLALALGTDRVFVGGTFTQIGGQTRNAVAKLDAAGAGDVIAGWDLDVHGAPVRALALSADGASLFVGGDFWKVGSPAPTDRAGLAKVAVATGSVDPGWAPEPGSVTALAVADAGLYVGGGFASGIGGKVRLGAARLALTGTGAADAWDPNPGKAATVFGVADDSPVGDRVAVGGAFSGGVRNVVRPGLARLAPDGTVDLTWKPQLVVADGVVTALALSEPWLYVGRRTAFGVDTVRRFSTTTGALDLGWQPVDRANELITALAVAGDGVFVGRRNPGTFRALQRISATGGGAVDAGWDAQLDGRVAALAVSGPALYVGGTFQGGTIGGVARSGLARLSTTDATVDTGWDPGPLAPEAILVTGGAVFVGGTFDTVQGLQRNRIAKLSAGDAATVDPAWNPEVLGQGVKALAAAGDDLYFGGSFGAVGGQPHLRVAKVARGGTGAPDAGFAPGVKGVVSTIVATTGRVLIGGEMASVDTATAQGMAIFDLSAPSAVIAVPQAGARYRLDESVAAAFGCGDPDGPADHLTCVGSVAPGTPIDTATAGVKSFTVTATDTGTNTGTATASYVVDATAPTVTFGALSGDGRYEVGEAALVTYTCGDADGSVDIATCAGPVASGGLLDTRTSGAKTFSVTATDRAGNATTTAVAYAVGPDRTRPVLSAWTVTPSAFRAEPRGAATGKATSSRLKRGTKVSFRLSEVGTVTFTVVRPAKGKVRAKTLGTFTVAEKQAGVTRFVFRGRVRGRTLKPGRYTLTAQAKDAAGLKSALLRKTVTVKR